jgi:hypothetical protein
VGVRASGVAARTPSSRLRMRARAAEAGLSGALSRGAFRGGRGGGTPDTGMTFGGLSLSDAATEGAGTDGVAESSCEGSRNGSLAPDEFDVPAPPAPSAWFAADAFQRRLYTLVFDAGSFGGKTATGGV